MRPYPEPSGTACPPMPAGGRRRWARAFAAAVASAGLVATGAHVQTARAAIPDPTPTTAVVSVHVGGDRDGSTTIGPRSGVTFGLFASEPSSYDPYDGYTDETPLYSCTSDADGECSFVVPIGAGGTAAGDRLWVAPTDGPPGGDTTWYANPVWQTAPLTGTTGRDQTRHVFQTPGLQAGQLFESGTGTFMNEPGVQTSPTHPVSEYTRRIDTGGTWPLSRVDPDLPPQCGLNVALVVDLSSSMNGSVVENPVTGAPGLVDAMDAFVNSLRGTPSQAALFTFSTNTPAINAGANTGLMPVASTADSNAFKALYAGWTNSTANGYTNWDRALAAVAAVNTASDPDQRFDLVVFITDGNPTVYGPSPNTGPGSRSGYTRFREIGNAVASANLAKASGGTIVNDQLIGGTRILAVGVGGGLDAGADRNLRSVSGRTEYDGTNITEADFIRTDDFDQVRDSLRDLFLSQCAPSVSVVKQIVPFGGTVADAYTPSDGWDFTAAATTTGVSVAPTSATTDTTTGALNFDLTFDDGVLAGGVDIAEDPRTADGYVPVQVAGANAVCENKSEDDAPVPVTNTGAAGFHVDVGLQDAVSCVVYNRAPDVTAASVVVAKRWRVITDVGIQEYEEGIQPADLRAHLTLTGPGASGATGQTWGVTRHGYVDQDVVGVAEDVRIGLPGCRLTDVVIDSPAWADPVDLPDPAQIDVTLEPGLNEYTITNTVACASHLTLTKRVFGGAASPRSWTLRAIAPGGALAGPDGRTGVTAEVTPQVQYQLAEQADADPELLNYVQDDSREDPAANPRSTGSMDCRVIGPGGRLRGFSGGGDGGVTVPLGQDVECVANNRTAPLTLVKQVDGGDARPQDFSFTATPLDPAPAGLRARSFAGSGAPGTTVTVRPGQPYRLAESGGDGRYRLTALNCTIDGAAVSTDPLIIPAGASAVCDAANQFVPPEPPPVPPPDPPAPPEPPVVLRGQVRVAKVADRTVARAGQRITYRIRVRAVGRGTARDIRVCDILPSSLVLVRAPGARVSGGRACWNIRSMRPGTRRTLTVVMSVPRMRGTRVIRNVVRVNGANITNATAQRRVRVLAATPHHPGFTG